MKVAVIAVVAAAAAAGTAVFVATRHSEPTADELLRKSMDAYAGFKSFQADCDWTMADKMKEKRSIAYESPNKFKIVSAEGEAKMTSVSDGKTQIEFVGPEMPAREQTAPTGLSEVDSMILGNPMMGGSLLYAFFGGSEDIDVVAGDGIKKLSAAKGFPENAWNVHVYDSGRYGNVTFTIGEDSGYVYEIRYDSEPLLKLARDRGMKGAEDAKMDVVETYSNIKTNASIDAATFETELPKTYTVIKSENEPPFPIGQKAPDFEVSTLDGQTRKLSDLKGKVVLIDFWATWCGPCVEALPHTDNIYKTYGDSGLEVMAISEETKEEVEPFIKDKAFAFPVYLDTKHSAVQAFKIDPIPAYAILDREGKLVKYFVGARPEKDILRALRKAGLQLKPN